MNLETVIQNETFINKSILYGDVVWRRVATMSRLFAPIFGSEVENLATQDHFTNVHPNEYFKGCGFTTIKTAVEDVFYVCLVLEYDNKNWQYSGNNYHIDRAVNVRKDGEVISRRRLPISVHDKHLQNWYHDAGFFLQDKFQLEIEDGETLSNEPKRLSSIKC